MTQRVQFLIGFRGVETGERFYEAGDVAQLSDEACSYLVLTGKAEIVLGAEEPPAEAPAEEPALGSGSDEAAVAEAQAQSAEFLAANPAPEPKRRGRR